MSLLAPWTRASVAYIHTAHKGTRLTTILVLWHAHGHCENFGKLEGHKAAILDLHWSRDSRNVFSASADTMLASWDVETGTRIHRYVGHEAIVNSLDVRARGGELIVSGSDDCSIGVRTICPVYGHPELKTCADLGSKTEGSL